MLRDVHVFINGVSIYSEQAHDFEVSMKIHSLERAWGIDCMQKKGVDCYVAAVMQSKMNKPGFKECPMWYDYKIPPKEKDDVDVIYN